MESSAPIFTSSSRQNLQACIQGTVLVPGDASYDTARRAWNLSIDQHPALIVIANNAQDIAEAVCFARDKELGVAVQSTGHGITLPADNCLLIITSRMVNVSVDADNHTAHVEAGATWGMVLEQAQAVGLAPLLGSSPTVGVVGYTLGGGMGWLARKYGLALDSVCSFEVVTADGNLLQCSDTENSDLFWALRGGGGSFGVITAMEIQLYPVTTVFGGYLIYPIGLARHIFQQYRAWISTVPQEMTSSVTIMNFPQVPTLPKFLRGQSVVIMRACYCGPVTQGEAVMNTWLNGIPPLVNTFREMPFTEVATISSDPTEPMATLSVGGDWLRGLNDKTIELLIQYGSPIKGSSPLVFIEVRHAGGAMAKVPGDANAFGYRDGSLVLNIVGATPTPGARLQLEHYINQFREALQPHLAEEMYINFVEGKSARQRTRNAYSPETYRRLQAVKAKYDPDDIFRYSYDISPAVADEI